MDHQPFNLVKAAEQGADLQLSGHTHHGQIFPINLITTRFMKSARDIRRSTHEFYVSSGFGTWGPPVRIGTRPEIVKIRLRFK